LEATGQLCEQGAEGQEESQYEGEVHNDVAAENAGAADGGMHIVVVVVV
jgi:hypothetical protein